MRVCVRVLALSGRGRPPCVLPKFAIHPRISSQLMKYNSTLFTMGGTSRDVCSRWTGEWKEHGREKEKTHWQDRPHCCRCACGARCVWLAFRRRQGGDSSTSAGAAKTEQTEEKKPEQEPYTISDETLDTSNPYGVKITGTLVNNTDEDKSYLQIEYNLYDADGAQIGTALANINNLKAGGTWKFEAASMEKPEDVANWERVDVSGF